MPQRTKVTGTRPFTLWLLIFIAAILVVGLIAGALIIYPSYQQQQKVEQRYQAGVAFQNMKDWEAAEAEYKQVVSIDANYKDVQTRLAEVKARLSESKATATAVAIAQAEQAQAEAQATAAAAPTATAEALEAHYQKGLGYMNIGWWEEAKAELEQVFEADPNYKEVQVKLAEVEGKLADIRALTPTTAPVTPTPVVIVSTNIAGEGRIEASSASTYQGGQCQQGSKAVDGIALGYPVDPCREWATNGEGTGAWLKITFTTPRHINQVVLYDRTNPDDHILEGTLSFSDGTTLRTGALPNDGSVKRFVFEPKTVQWVQFTVDQADGPNTGLAEVEIYGW